MQDLTPLLKQQDMILISFYRVSGASTNKVPYEELILQLWHDFPETFSLRNHPEHPDASDVHKKLYNGPLKDEGLIISLGNKVFRLTDKGIVRSSEILTASETTISTSQPTKQEKTRLGRDAISFIKHAKSSRAFATWLARDHHMMVDYDARVFFQFSTGTNLDDRRLKVNFAIEAIQNAKNIGIEGSDDLANLANFLIDRFGGLLKGTSI